MKKLSLVIPAKNEEKRMLPPLLELYHTLARVLGPKNFELIIIVNNSNDKTYKLGKLFRSALSTSSVRVYDIGSAEGKGDAVRRGLEKAKGEYIGFIDADGSYTPIDVLRMLFALERNNEYSGVIVNRYQKKSHMEGKLNLGRFIFSRLYNLGIRILYGLHYQDTQSGVKIFRKEVIEDILPHIFVYGWAFDTNILLMMKAFGYKVLELPVVWSQKEGSKISFIETMVKVSKELVTLTIRYYAFVIGNLFKPKGE